MNIAISILKRITAFLYGVVLLVFMQSCDSIFYDYEGDCAPKYFMTYTDCYNMKEADAFHSEVRQLRLFTFDSEGKFVKEFSAQTDGLKASQFKVPLDLEPGTYQFVTWAVGEEGFGQYNIPNLEKGKSVLEDLDMALQTSANHEVNKKLGNLFYGFTEKTLVDYEVDKPVSDYASYQYVNTDLIKNTNDVKIILQLLGDDFDANDYDCFITYNNDKLNVSNNIASDSENLTYRFYNSEKIESELDSDDLNVASSGLRMDFRLNRLFVDVEKSHQNKWNKYNNSKAIFKLVDKKRDKVVLKFSLIDYLLLYKNRPSSNDKNVGDQEYLDRKDDYTSTIIIDNTNHVLSASVYILGWKVVEQNVDL